MNICEGTLERQYARVKPTADEAEQRKRELERETEELKKVRIVIL